MYVTVYVAVCVAVCCKVVQCSTVVCSGAMPVWEMRCSACCSVLQWCCSALHCVAVCCSVLQCVLQCGVVRCSGLWNVGSFVGLVEERPQVCYSVCCSAGCIYIECGAHWMCCSVRCSVLQCVLQCVLHVYRARSVERFRLIKDGHLPSERGKETWDFQRICTGFVAPRDQRLGERQRCTA